VTEGCETSIGRGATRDVARRLARPRNLLLVMTLFQVLWLAIMWAVGISSQWAKLPSLIAVSLAVGVAIYLVPIGWASRLTQFGEGLLRNDVFPLLTLAAVALAIGVTFAIHQRTFMDEQASFAASRVVAERGVASFFANYRDIGWLGIQHPPLMPLVYGTAMRWLGVNVYVMRFLCLALTTGTVLLTYALGRELYDRETGFRSALFLMSFPLILRIGSAGMIDVPMVFFFSLAMWLSLRLLRAPRCELAVVAGLALGAGLLV
jgi:hypothetical protein